MKKSDVRLICKYFFTILEENWLHKMEYPLLLQEF